VSPRILWFALAHVAVVHSWTRLKATNIDTLLGFNTYLKVYWPLAQQDELLMSALIGVARSAQCLSLGKHPTDDPLVLQHGSRALAQLRQRLSLGHMNATVIFTMDWLINIAYMTSDRAAFNIHWSAFRSAARRYIAGRNDPIATVIQHRIRSWKTLHDYRAHNDHFQPITHDRLTYLPGDHGFPALVSGFAQLVSEGNLSLEMAERLLPIQHALFHGGPPGAQYRLDLQSLLKQKRMKSLDFHICLATLALTLERGHTLSDELPLLSDIAQAYINRPLKWSSDLGREALIWSSLILGHTLLSLPDTLHPHVDIQPEHSMHSSDLQIQHLRAEGHIVIIAIWQQLVPPPPLALGSTAIKSAASSLGTTRPPSRRPSPWSALSPNTLRRNFPMPGYLEEQLRLTYEEAMRRQQRWDDEKLLEIGKPLATGDAEKPGICVEYLVLREGRESLPAVG
jgi:hypothetical protein